MTTKTVILTEGQMEKYLTQRGADIFESSEERLIDSVKLAEEATTHGFESYMLEGVGKYQDQLLFIKEVDYFQLGKELDEKGQGNPLYHVWGRMGMSGYLTQEDVDRFNNREVFLNDLIEQGLFVFDGDTYFPDVYEGNEIIDYPEANL